MTMAPEAALTPASSRRAPSLPAPPFQFHVEQQADATNFAMWLFLLTEIMFFGGLFTAYLIYRNWYYPAFVAGRTS
jgi:heme/copper-type cytochrome/quinol oxidase subunit 3